MKTKKLVKLALQNGVRFEVFDRCCSIVVSSDDSIETAYFCGFDNMLDSDIAYISIVHSDKQPRTLQIYTK